jgi:hypothetical protein
MSKFKSIKDYYLNKGVSEDNIDYVISGVQDGAKREHILESLTADYRGMSHENADNLLNSIYGVSGGEFKKENRGGYLYGAFFLLIGIPCAIYIFFVLSYGGILVRPVLIFAGAGFGILGGIGLIVKSILGKYRDADEPFNS